jgi:uncharacterized membrane protein YfcA
MLSGTAAAIVFGAGILRGLTGFGFALVAVIGLSQIAPLSQVTPLVLLIEIAIAVVLLGDGVMLHAEIRRLVPLILGGLAGIPIGIFGLSALPANLVKPALDLAVLACALAALVHISAPKLDNRRFAAAVGCLVGALIAAFAVGGPFAVVWQLAIGAEPAAIRANLTVFFLVMDAIALAARAGTIGIPEETALGALILLPAALAGAILGGRLFRRVEAQWWRRIAAYSIAGASLVSLGRSLMV